MKILVETTCNKKDYLFIDKMIQRFDGVDTIIVDNKSPIRNYMQLYCTKHGIQFQTMDVIKHNNYVRPYILHLIEGVCAVSDGEDDRVGKLVKYMRYNKKPTEVFYISYNNRLKRNTTNG